MTNVQPTSEDAPNLGSKVARGLRWSMVDTVVQQVVRFAVTVVLTRLVAPDDFGVIAMALVFTQLAALIGDLGLGPALVQRKEITRTHVVTATTTTFLVGLVLTAVFAALAVPIARLYDEPYLTPVLLALSISYLLRGVAGIPRDLLRRSMQFQKFVIASGTAVTLSGVLAIVAAFAGAGVWALVVQVLVENVVATVMAVALAWRGGLWQPGWGIDRAALKELGHFGAFVSGTRIAYYGASNVDNFIVGKVLGATALGLYNLAYRLMLFPILKVADVVANVTMPAMATIQDDLPRIATAFRRAVQYIGLVCFPVSIGTCIAAPALVPAVFGSKWGPAVVVVQILALNGVRLALGRLNGVVYEATGRPALDFVMLSATFAAYLVAFVIGVHWGIAGVAWGYTIAGYLLLPVDQFLVNRALRTTPLQLLGGLAPVAIATVLLAIVGQALMLFLPGSLDDLPKAAIVVLASAVAYVAGLQVASPGLLRSLRQDLARR